MKYSLCRNDGENTKNIMKCFRVCVTRSGEVYTCGDNEKGQLGRGKVVPNHWELAKVGGDLEGEMVTKVVTSGSTVLALTGW